MEITRHCNLNCQHCYAVRQKRKELSTKEIKTIIEQLQKENTLILNFSGGEIFTRKDFFEIAQFAKKRKFAIKFFTNGTLINEDTADKIKELNPLKVEITIFSLKPKIHDLITGLPGSLKRSLRALSLLSQRNLSLRIKSTLMKQNVSGYREIMRLANDLGAQYQFEPSIIPRTNGTKNNLKYRISKKDIFRLFNDPEIKIKEELNCNQSRQKEKEILCSAGHNSVTISAYGDVFPCIALPIKLGNLRKHEFSSIWKNSDWLKKWRSVGIGNLKACSGCSLYTYCNRCPGLAYSEDKDILGPSRRACEIAMTKFDIVNS